MRRQRIAERAATPGTGSSLVRLVPFGFVEADVLDVVRTALGDIFGVDAVAVAPIELRMEWYRERRRQYPTAPFLDLLAEQYRAEDGWTVGLVDADLFSDNINFAFGEAFVGGSCAVVGLARLRPNFHDRPPDRELFHQRVVVEVIHELGHVAGLPHCDRADCVMRFSNALADVDRKSHRFCADCRARLAANKASEPAP